MRKRAGPPQIGAMAHPVIYHVTPSGNLWKVGIPGDSQPVSFHQDKDEAIAHAAQLARQHPPARVMIHKADGTVGKEYAPSSVPGRGAQRSG